MVTLFALLTLAAAAAVGTLAAPVDGTLSSSSLLRRAATVYSACAVPNTVALTFDDGPYLYTQEVVDQLDKVGAKGTFFFNGNNYDCIYNEDEANRVKYAYDHGHMVASHTWSHKDLSTLNRDQIVDEMSRVEEAIQKITGALVGFMRPPYGSYNQQVLDVAGERGQSVAIWDFDSRDSVGATPAESEALYDDAINRHPSNILALNHETLETTVHQVLPYAIKKLQAAGYILVSLSECLGQPAYQSIDPPQPRDGTWTC